jgi:hypothetical protein
VIEYKSFLPEVLPYTRECPELAAVNAIRNACIEFCDRSHWLLHHHDAIDVVAGTSTYTLDPPAGTTIARIVDAWFAGHLLAPIGEDNLKTMYFTDWREAEGTPAFYTHLDPNEVILAPIPQQDEVEALTIIAALRPTRASTSVEDSVYERWAEYIGFGARARLHDINGQPYYDPAVAARCRAMFERGMNIAAIERNKGLTRHVAHVQFRTVI